MADEKAINDWIEKNILPPGLPPTGTPLDATPRKLKGHPGKSVLSHLKERTISPQKPTSKWWTRKPGTEALYAEPDYAWQMGEVDAWHGSPHKFAKFATSKIGTGEGAQAFGWGLYFTDKKDIARHYSETLGQFSKSDRKKIANEAVKRLESRGPGYLSKREMDIVNRDFNNWVSGANPTFPTWLGGQPYNIELRSVIDNLYNRGIVNKGGQTYKVKLHKGKDPSEYTWLDWDKEVTPEFLKTIIKQANDEGLRLGRYESVLKSGRVDEYVDKGWIGRGQNIYEELTSKFGSDKEASLFLLRSGIDGIRYPAGSLSGIKSKGKNYVVFDEAAVTTEEVIGGGRRKIFINKPIPQKFVQPGKGKKPVRVKK